MACSKRLDCNALAVFGASYICLTSVPFTILCEQKKAVHKTSTTDDKRLQNTLKRLGVNNIPAIEEVNLFKENGQVIHFQSPKVQASIAANTYVVSGQCETKSKSTPPLVATNTPVALFA